MRSRYTLNSCQLKFAVSATWAAAPSGQVGLVVSYGFNPGKLPGALGVGGIVGAQYSRTNTQTLNQYASPMKTDACPKCGSIKRELGEIFPAGVMWDIRFKAETAPKLSLKKKVVAVACSSCGYIELFLADHET